MDVLRSKGRLTRLLILLELVNNRHTNLKGIAKNLDITPQAVSEYLRQMGTEGLTAVTEGHYRATKEGVNVLQGDLLEIKGFVDDKISSLEIIRSCTAIAGRDVKKGQKVGLFMRDGLLYAEPEHRSTSTGVSSADVKAGSVFTIYELEGMLKLAPGTLRLMAIPPISASRLPKAKLEEQSRPGAKVAAMDLESIGLLRQNSIRCDYEYPNMSYIINNIERGLDVVVFGTPQSISAAVKVLSEHNEKSLDKVRYEYKNLK